MTRQRGKFYWTYSKFSSKNFNNSALAKKNLKLAIKKNPNIRGNNMVWFTKHIIHDIQYGYYGVSGKWWQIANPSDIRRWKSIKNIKPVDSDVWEPSSRSPYWSNQN